MSTIFINVPVTVDVVLLVNNPSVNPNASIYVDPPVFVYADFEAMLSPDKIHLPILVCAATSLSDIIHSFYGSDCMLKIEMSYVSFII